MANSIVTSEIASSVLNGVIEVNGTRRNYDSSSDERRCIKLSKEQIDYYSKEFSYNVGTVSDGKLIRLEEKEIYFRLPVNISMIKSDSIEESFVYKASLRAEEEKPSLQVFVDGNKIPDNEVLFYPTKSNVDIFFPLNYLNKNGESTIIVEKILYNITPYIRYYNKKTSGQSFNIKITKEQYERANLDSVEKFERIMQIYINKKLYLSSRNISIVNKSNIVISIHTQMNDAEIEIIMDPSIQYLFPNVGVTQDSDDKVIFSVPETYIDSIHGPLSKFSCYFYIDGKRLSNDDVEQIGRLHFRYKLPKLQTSIISMCVTDRNFIDDRSVKLYGSDYYLYNMIGCGAVTKQYITGVSETIFDNNIDFDEVLNNNNTLYDRELLNKLISDYDKSISPSNKVGLLLEDRPYLMRTFLEKYGNRTFTYNVSYGGKDPFVYFGIPSTYSLTNSRDYDISINTHHIPSDEIEIINKNITDVFKIDAKYFNIGDNDVEINVIDDLPIEYEIFKLSDIQTSDGFSSLVVKSFKRAKYANYIYVLEKISKDDRYNYVNDNNVGYRYIPDASIEIDEDGYVNILFDTLPEGDFIVYNANFSCVYTYMKPIYSTTKDIAIPVYTGSDANPIPFIPRGKIEMYAGNEKLIDGIDYYIKHPINEKTAAGSFIIVKRAILPGTQFDIYFSNMKTKQIVSHQGYFKNNRYGLFYLGNLKYPASIKYLNIFLNNKKVNENDIDILSDKLIRIHSLNTPLYDLSIESTFTVEEEELIPYMNLYKEDNFEKYIESLFKAVYYNRPFDPDEEEPPDPNKVYETFIETVDSVNRRPNPTAREEEWIPSDNDDPDKIGVSNNGTAMGGENINVSLIAGGYIIFAGDKGRVATYNINSSKWNNYNDDDVFANDGSFVNNENITSICFGRSYIIFGTDRGHIGVYDMIKQQWFSINSPLMKEKLNKLTEDIFPDKSINKIIYFKDSENYDREYLFIMGDGGNVSTYIFNEDTWYGYTDKDHKEIACVEKIIENIYDGYISEYNAKPILVVAGSKGEIASCTIENNGWCNPDGTKNNPRRTCAPIHNDGVVRNNKDIYTHSEYLNYVVYSGKDGIVSVFDKIENAYSGSPLDTKKIANNGSHSANNDDNCIVTYESSMLIAGSNLGKISNYNGNVQNWRNSDFNGGLSDKGSMMNNSNINSIVYTIGKNNYVIFSGDNGRVCSYNVDVHEVPFRYNPYKTAFLSWYTTPGNAVITTTFDISQELADKFSMYHDESDNYDISCAGGDTDIIVDIDMNDGGAYPYTHGSRLHFFADLIRKMGNERYTCDQVYEYYMKHKYHNMLYERDLIPLSGSFLDCDEDIQIT